MLAIESARILSDAIDLLRGNPTLAHRVGAFELIASRTQPVPAAAATELRN